MAETLLFEVKTSKAAYEHYRDTLGEMDSATIAAKRNLERYQQEHAEATAGAAIDIDPATDLVVHFGLDKIRIA